MVQPINIASAIIKETVPDMMCYRGGTTSMDFDDITTPGSYLVTKAKSMSNAPSGYPTDYGTLIVYPGYYPVQELHPTTTPDRYYRRILVGSSWKPWLKFTGEALT